MKPTFTHLILRKAYNAMKNKLILASASPRRLELLKQIDIVPDEVLPADINETPLEREKPKDMALRLAIGKAEKIRKEHTDSFILAADSTVACGRKLLDKAESQEQAVEYIAKLSGRRHHVYGGICLITPSGKVLTRQSDTLVQFKPLSAEEKSRYIASGEWEGKAGGYGIQGMAGAFVKYMAGSYSNVVGLSLYDTMKILEGGHFLKTT